MQYISERKISLPHSHRHQAASVNVYVNAEVDCRKMADSFISLWPFSIQTHLVLLLFLLYRYIGAISPSMAFLIVCKSHWPLPHQQP